jgi:hypothetical protein
MFHHGAHEDHEEKLIRKSGIEERDSEIEGKAAKVAAKETLPE